MPVFLCNALEKVLFPLPGQPMTMTFFICISFTFFIAEESRTHTVLLGKYLHLRQRKCLQYLILLRIFSLHLRNICSRKTAQHPPALNFLMAFVKASRSKIRILRGDIWHKTRKILAAGLMSSALFGYTNNTPARANISRRLPAGKNR